MDVIFSQKVHHLFSEQNSTRHPEMFQRFASITEFQTLSVYGRRVQTVQRTQAHPAWKIFRLKISVKRKCKRRGTLAIEAKTDSAVKVEKKE